jgi:N-acetylglutamate synthase and related acetyltransferases
MIPFFMRRAKVTDIETVNALLSANDLPTEGVADAIDDFIVAEVGDRLIGAIGLELYGRTGLLRSAVVSGERRGQGIGRALVGELLSKARSGNLDSLYLLTTTAEPYFESFGFAVVNRADVPEELNASAELRGACPDTATVMRLRLQAWPR